MNALGLSRPGIVSGLWLGCAIALAPVCEFFFRGAYSWEIGRAVVVGVLQAGTLAALLLAAMTDRALNPSAASGSRRVAWNPGPGAAAKWLVAILAGALISALAGGRVLGSIPALSYMMLAVLVFLLASGGGGSVLDRKARMIAAGLLAGGALAAVYALMQRFGGLTALQGVVAQAGEGVPLPMIRARIEEGRSFSFFLYPNALAGFLLLGLPCAVESCFRHRGRTRLLYVLLAILLAGGLLASGSIGGAAALLLSVGLMSAHPAAPGKLRVSVVVLLISLVLVGVVASRPSSASWAGFSAKLHHWAEAVTAPRALSVWFLGHGPGRYGEAVGGRLAEGLRSRYAHNWLVETFCERGAVGLVLLGGFLLWMIRLVWRGALSSGMPFAWGLAGGWLGSLIHSLADIDYALPVLAFPWWAIGGLFASAKVTARVTGADRLKQGGSATPGLWAGPLWLLIAVAFLPLMVGARSALALGGFLGCSAAAFAYLYWRGCSPPPTRLVVDGPWLLLLLVGAGWTIVSPAPGLAYQNLLEGAGLLAVVWMARWVCAQARSARRLALGRVPNRARDSGAGPAPNRALRSGSGQAEYTLRCGVMGIILLYALWTVAEDWFGGTLTRAFPSPNFLAAFLLFGFGLSLASLRRQLGPFFWFAACALVTTGWGVAVTGSSGAVLAAGAVMMLLLVRRAFSCRRPAGSALRRAPRTRDFVSVRGSPEPFRGWLVAGALAALLALGAVAIPQIDALSLIHRVSVWREGAVVLRQNPFGIGPGRYAVGVDLVRAPSMTAAGLSRYSQWARFAHNEPLQLAVEWGLPALGLMIWGFWVAARSCGGRGTRGPWAWAVLAVLLHSLVDFPLRAPVIKILIAIALGVMISPGRRGGAHHEPSGVGYAGPLRAGRRWLLGAVSIWIGVTCVRPAMSRWQVEHPREPLRARLEQAVQARAVFPLSAAAASFEAGIRWDRVRVQEVRVPATELTRRTYETLVLASALSGHTADAQLRVGRFLLERAQIRRGHRGRSGGRRPGAPGAAEARTRDLDEARRMFVAAGLARPHWHLPWTWLALAWMEEGRWPQAEAALAEVERREPFFLYAGILRGEIEERRGKSAAARRWYRRALVLQAHLRQRPHPNGFERALYEFDAGAVKGRLIDMKPDRPD